MAVTALVVFLAALGTAFVGIALLVRSALVLYRTLSSAYDDFQAWVSSFNESTGVISEALRGMENRAASVLESFNRVRETLEDIHDAVEELRSSPLLRLARFLGRRP